MGSHKLEPAVSPMSGSPTYDTEKKMKQKNRAGQIYNFATALRAGEVKTTIAIVYLLGKQSKTLNLLASHILGIL